MEVGQRAGVSSLGAWRFRGRAEGSWVDVGWRESVPACLPLLGGGPEAAGCSVVFPPFWGGGAGGAGPPHGHT